MRPRKINVAEYDNTAREINAPIYQYYAQQIVKKTGKTHGVCLDAGCGGGYLGLALARMTRFSFIFLDASPKMLERAALHIVEDKLVQRACTLLADVHRIPLDDGWVDSVISRGPCPSGKIRKRPSNRFTGFLLQGAGPIWEVAAVRQKSWRKLSPG